MSLSKEIKDKAHQTATELLAASKSGRSIVLSFDSLRLLIENCMVDGMALYRDKLTGK